MHIETFNSDEELFAHMEKARQEADAAVQPWQAAAKPGDHYLRFCPDVGLIIYGELIDPLTDAEPDEVEDLRELRSQPHMKNYRFGRHYSQACPLGELGDVHVCNLGMLLTKEEFEVARQQNWPIEGPGLAWDDYIAHRDHAQLEEAVRAALQA